MTIRDETRMKRMHSDAASRFEEFAENQDLGITEAIDLVAYTVLDSEGKVRPQARGLLNNSQNISEGLPEYSVENQRNAEFAKRSRSGD